MVNVTNIFRTWTRLDRAYEAEVKCHSAFERPERNFKIIFIMGVPFERAFKIMSVSSRSKNGDSNDLGTDSLII